MKISLKAFFFLAIVWTSNAHAQGYLPMLNDSAVWVIGERSSSIFGPSVRYYQESLERRLTPIQPYPEWYTITSPSPTYGFMLGYSIAEDTVNRKVYVQDVFNPTSTWTILYDFNVQPGDTVSHIGFVSPIFELNMYVDSVKTQFFANANRKFIYLSPVDTLSTDKYASIDHNPMDSLVSRLLVWIEGIGSQHGLNYFLMRFAGGSPNEYNFLSCRFDYGFLTYQNSFLQSCMQPLGIEVEKYKVDIKPWNVYFSSIDRLEVVSRISSQESFSIKLTDRMGRQVYTKDLCQVDSEGRISIHGQFPYGMLFCTIATSKTHNHYKLFRP